MSAIPIETGEGHGTSDNRTITLGYDACSDPWLLFLEGQPDDILTMRPWLDTSLPADASDAEVTHLIGELLQRATGHLPAQVQLTQRADGPGYTFVATFEEAARLANYAGGIVVMKRGTATLSADELRTAVLSDLG